MFLSVSENLPTTAYIKMIEIWLILALIVPFLEVLVLTFIHIASEDSEASEMRRVHPTTYKEEEFTTYKKLSTHVH